jgi:hypothetical protein
VTYTEKKSTASYETKNIKIIFSKVIIKEMFMWNLEELSLEHWHFMEHGLNTITLEEWLSLLDQILQKKVC